MGLSEGSYDDGRGELQDLKAAASFLSTAHSIRPENVAFAGYSFGAEMVIRLAAHSPHPIPLVAVSPVFSSVTGKQWKSIPGPKLVICGDSDAFLLAERLIAAVPEKQRHIVTGEDHFWLRKLDEMADVAGDFFARQFSLALSSPTTGSG